MMNFALFCHLMATADKLTVQTFGQPSVNFTDRHNVTLAAGSLTQISQVGNFCEDQHCGRLGMKKSAGVQFKAIECNQVTTLQTKQPGGC